MATLAQWISGARPQTLPAALAPVAAGTGAAVAMGGAYPLRGHARPVCRCGAFFGLVAVLGTTYSQAGVISFNAHYAAIGIGALACAILIANDMGNFATDKNREIYICCSAGNISDQSTLCYFVGRVACYGNFHSSAIRVAWLTFLVLPLFIKHLQIVLGKTSKKSLLPVNRDTERIEFVYGILFYLSIKL